ncbi:MAG TPA: CPBP family intramembrane glutamic endopeptidase [Gemmataceae bacterium]|nr:CPBP family intramembrane glutamic endopeptidase [Gemmataceae bacterium]
MKDEPSPVGGVRPPSKWHAWGNALAITLLGLLVGGLGCFFLLGNYLLREIAAERLDLLHAGIWWEIGFTVGMVVILFILIPWQRARGTTLADVGWGRPTTPLALVLAVLLGTAFLCGSYFGARRLLPGVDVMEMSWVRLVLAPLGILLAAAEETMMRGFFMTGLQRARVSTWMQIVASGTCSASYHALQNPTLMGFVPSFVLFSMHAGLYVLGKRSLTPVVLTHSIYHVLGEPYLLMMALVAMKH